MTLVLTRECPEGNAVWGTISILPSPSGEGTGLSFRTLENHDYLIPRGTYPLDVTYSPRFRRLMPLVCAVPGRTGIRIHPGSRPEHSRGCILVSSEDERAIRQLVSSHAPVTLRIISCLDCDNFT